MNDWQLSAMRQIVLYGEDGAVHQHSVEHRRSLSFPLTPQPVVWRTVCDAHLEAAICACYGGAGGDAQDSSPAADTERNFLGSLREGGSYNAVRCALPSSARSRRNARSIGI